MHFTNNKLTIYSNKVASLQKVHRLGFPENGVVLYKEAL